MFVVLLKFKKYEYILSICLNKNLLNPQSTAAEHSLRSTAGRNFKIIKDHKKGKEDFGQGRKRGKK